MKCRWCGQKLERRHKFCGMCGKPTKLKFEGRNVVIDMHCRNCNTTRRSLGSMDEKWRPQYCHQCGCSFPIYSVPA